MIQLKRDGCPLPLCYSIFHRFVKFYHIFFLKIQNDVCPAQRLGEHDILFVRKGYELATAIKFGYYGGRPVDIKAKIKYFNSAKTMINIMKFK